MAKICSNCWTPAINGTEHKLDGKTICHDCAREAQARGELVTEPKGFWSSVFYEATQIMKERPTLGAETAFWMAKAKVSGQPEFSFKPKEA